jgi:hypothetical protein
MYKYFVPDPPDGGKIELATASGTDKAPSAYSRGDIVPLYDEDGSTLIFFFYSY